MGQCINGYRYHTIYDTIDAIPRGAFQNTGDNVLSVVRGLANASELHDIRVRLDILDGNCNLTFNIPFSGSSDRTRCILRLSWALLRPLLRDNGNILELGRCWRCVNTHFYFNVAHDICVQCFPFPRDLLVHIGSSRPDYFFCPRTCTSCCGGICLRLLGIVADLL